MTHIGSIITRSGRRPAVIDDQGKVILEMRVLNDSRSLKVFLSRIVKRVSGEQE